MSELTDYGRVCKLKEAMEAMLDIMERLHNESSSVMNFGELSKVKEIRAALDEATS